MGDPCDDPDVTVDLDRICELANPLLEAARNGGKTRAAVFAPRDGDFARIFTPSLVDTAIATYTPMWNGGVEITAKPEQTEMLLRAARAENLGATDTFPGGYKQIAPHLLPGRVWLAWKYVRPQQTVGMAYDGLVWLDDHFVWCPKPWRLLAKTSDPFYVD